MMQDIVFSGLDEMHAAASATGEREEVTEAIQGFL